LSKPLSFEGADVISWRAAILEGLEGSPGLGDFLADPVKVPADDWINWYSPLKGEPWALDALPQDRRDKAASRAASRLDEFRRAAERLRGSDRFRSRQAGEIMLAAVSCPQALAFFDLDGETVCAGWGMGAAAPLPFEPEAEPPPPPEVLAPPPEAFEPPPPPPAPEPPPPPIVGRARRLAWGAAAALALGLIGAVLLSPALRGALKSLTLGPWGQGVETREAVIDGLRGELDRARADYSSRRGDCLIVPPGPSPGSGAEYLDGCYASRAGLFFDASSGEERVFAFCAPGDGGTPEILVSAAGGGEGCRAGATAAAESGRLTVASAGAAVCGGDSYPAFRITCEAGSPDGVQAACFMEEDDGEGGFYGPVPVELRRSWPAG
jgi:hypothetical protein